MRMWSRGSRWGVVGGLVGWCTPAGLRNVLALAPPSPSW